MDILIAGVSARGLVESAIRSGLHHRIVAVDYFGDFDLGLLCTHRSIKNDLNLSYEAHHLITASSCLAWGALAYVANLENYPSVVEVMAGGKPILGNSPAVLSSVRDPAGFFGFLTRAAIPAPKIAFDPSRLNFDSDTLWLRKPLQSGGGHGIALHLPGDHLEDGFFLQEYLDGLPCGAVFAADGWDACLLGISEQLIGRTEFGADGFRYCGSILGSLGTGQTEWGDLVDRVRQVVRAITREFHLVGVNGIDFILKGKTVYPLEINPRYTASMELVEQAYGLNIFTIHLDACQGRLPDFDLLACPDAGCFGKAILFASQALIFHDPRWWFDQGARDLPYAGEQIMRGKPVCTVFSRGQSRSECLDRLTRAAVEIEWTCLHATTPGRQ
ncbi:ATP-grasp domain-containing protein [Candidatus Methylomirabilis sp.]|uniref:ATP-grasp domain-containing protein n=1 Tax=Candidatus Methylomirabilis sp. TaxID=2032687 RepID=UPI002A5CA03A|nr:ATP-grasp domain-containing protein [Candidatus Methylomirabilis sp.]